jgi:hypothetical protein
MDVVGLIDSWYIDCTTTYFNLKSNDVILSGTNRQQNEISILLIADRTGRLFGMRHLMLFIAGLVFTFGAMAFTPDKPTDIPAKTQPVKSSSIKAGKETRVSFTGIVKEITDTTIMVERAVKGNVEIMEFALDKPVENIKAGDKVKVSYIKKDGKNIVIKVAPAVTKRIIKKAAPAKEVKPTPVEALPPKK